MKKKVIVRGGPSPTSPYGLHVGNIRTLLYNYLFAKQHDGIFYIRIEDTDRKRFQAGAEELIKKSLEWCGIEPDHSPWQGGPAKLYRQSERDYGHYVQHLLDTGWAYYAFDTPEELEVARKENKYFSYNYQSRDNMKNSLTLSPQEVEKRVASGKYVVRFKVPQDRTIIFEDMIRGEVKFNSNELDDKILLKSNGIGSYHLCNVCDDHDMKTTHVIRGEEWLPSAPLHVLLYEAFGWEAPQFAHLPLVLNPPGHPGKLSKRKSAALGFPIFPYGKEEIDKNGKVIETLGFKDEGYEPEALMNFISLLGWNPGDDSELMSMDDMIEKFSFDKVGKSGAKFDIEKLKWFNSQYVNQLPIEVIFSPEIIAKYDRQVLEKIASLAKERATFRKDLQPILDIFLKNIDSCQNSQQLNDPFKDTFQEFLHSVEDLDFTIGQDIKDRIYQIGVKQKGHKFRDFMPGLRQALTGGVSGPDLMTIMTILGKKESLNRIEKAIDCFGLGKTYTLEEK